MEQYHSILCHTKEDEKEQEIVEKFEQELISFDGEVTLLIAKLFAKLQLDWQSKPKEKRELWQTLRRLTYIPVKRTFIGDNEETLLRLLRLLFNPRFANKCKFTKVMFSNFFRHDSSKLSMVEVRYKFKQ